MMITAPKAVEEHEQKALVTVDLAKDTKDARVAAQAIGVPVSAIDQKFGVVVVNPAMHRHAARVDLSAFEHRKRTKFAVAGPYADPVIGNCSPSGNRPSRSPDQPEAC